MKTLVLLFFISVSFLTAKEFNLQKEISKCQKCHGEKFDEQVLNASRKISSFSKNEILTSFDKYLNAPKGGKAGLMKIILKKYSKSEREKIADYIVKNH